MFCLPNLFTIRVGDCLAFVMAFVMVPFVVLSVMAIPHFSLDTLTEHKPLTLETMMALFNIVFWNMNGFDCASTFAGEVKNPKVTYSRAMPLVVLITMLCYVVPLALLSCVSDWHNWTDGSLTQAATFFGTWASTWVLVA